jgi:hypothetical protein
MRDDNRRELTPTELYRQRRKEQIQRRRLVAGLCLLGLIIVIIVLVVTCSGDSTDETTTTTSGETTSTTLGAATYTAELTGADSVPVVETDATGTFILSYDPESEEAAYSLEVNGLDSPSLATIYQGIEGESGTAVYTCSAAPLRRRLLRRAQPGTIDQIVSPVPRGGLWRPDRPDQRQ